MIQYKFNNASEAFDFYYGVIPKEGIDFDGTKAMFNQGFTLEKPWTSNEIQDEAGLKALADKLNPVRLSAYACA